MHWVLMHDDNIQRVTGVDRALTAYTWNELQSVKVKSIPEYRRWKCLEGVCENNPAQWKCVDPPCPGNPGPYGDWMMANMYTGDPQPIGELEAMLTFAHKNKLMVEIDVKNGDMQTLVNVVEKTKMMSNVFFCPWEWQHAVEIRRASKAASIYIACDSGGCIDTAQSLPAQGVAIRWNNGDPEHNLNRMRQIVDAGLGAHVYEVDLPGDLEALKNSGIPCSFDTNSPKLGHAKMQRL